MLEKIDGKIFIDRDPDIFKLLISQLRNPQIDLQNTLEKPTKQLFEEECKYWGIKQIEKEKSPVETLPSDIKQNDKTLKTLNEK